jgi:hypothetical protein
LTRTETNCALLAVLKRQKPSANNDVFSFFIDNVLKK